ncbi:MULTISPECIES: phenylacetic acid degradation operon negative regulatory protein PaaX [Clostridia]|uniref:phenylacetic acid degradation operon negative regulatory protein PaaX n=1 Tax=Clostridia TaxID=186801 RepID=UPI000EA083A5|nr:MULTISPECIES: phenylacetic acid degradation operon negative regulatory protein PaaX [Clostridia]NBJ68107.1 phenylacetic acid degradation operon negative regulatory protein PaaX [Roseburia sp. 1XD42-34]RKI81883.1 phenylacetic acid degradation operon negative regulatory protein PaaX [Clostridium sp. 1xD42-85]
MQKKLNTRSMIFTLFGDYIRYYGNEIWMGSLIKLLEPFHHNEQAVRSAISRMSKQEWVVSRKEANKSYYSLTERGKKRMEEAAGRIYRLEPETWDGKWRMLLYNIPEEKRQIRDELRKELIWSGFGLLSNGVWITPNNLKEQIYDIIDKYKIKEYVYFFEAENEGFQANQQIIRSCWDIDHINSLYQKFIHAYENKMMENGKKIEQGQMGNKACFVERTLLVHYYRKSLFVDPGIPKELLPEKWLGEQAAKLFSSYYNILAEKANAFFEKVYAEGYTNQKNTSTPTISNFLELVNISDSFNER